MVQILQGPCALPPPTTTTTTTLIPPTKTLSVMSYNILLPNSVDGWWTYKMYSPPVAVVAKNNNDNDDEDAQNIASWEYRRDLIQERIRLVDPTIVCFQEVAPTSFDEDFAFMSDLGFDGKEIFKRGRFRPATFWKRTLCELVTPAVHKDRTLLTAFRIKNAEEKDVDNPGHGKDDHDGSSIHPHWYVLNCHLQAGKQAPRRVRQINEGVRSVLTLARKLKEKEPERIPLIVCGDFNGGAECGAVRYLEDGVVDDTFLEDGAPVTSSEKRLPLASPMYDVMTLGRDDGKTAAPPPPPSMVVSELISLLVAPKTSVDGNLATAWDEPDMSELMRAHVERIFHRLATSFSEQEDGTRVVMSVANVEEWLTIINGQVGRGDEFREAARQMGWQAPEHDPEARITELPADGVLTLEGFIAVYSAELRAGKFWSIAHDFDVLGDPLPITDLYKARYDRMYASEVVEAVAVLDFESTRACPNDVEPSDHLPVVASFCLKQE